MKIHKAIETPQGTVLFDGELSEAEYAYVLELGLNWLLFKGALVPTEAPPMAESTDTLQ